jgi:hypothetical protein
MQAVIARSVEDVDDGVCDEERAVVGDVGVGPVPL